MTVPVSIYLAFNAGGAGAHGWGAAMSTDTAFALGAVAVLTPRAATRTRVFLLTLAVVDDLFGLVVIATVYTAHVSVPALVIAAALFGVLLALRYLPPERRRPLFWAVALGLWIAMFKSGVDPVIAGLAVGLATSAYEPAASGSRARYRGRSLLPRAADAGAGALGAAECALCDLAERASAVSPAPVDQLRDRAAVRARQSRRPSDGRPAQ